MKAKNIALGFNKSQPKRLTGIVEIITGNNVAKITLVDLDKDEKPKKFVGGSESIKVALEDLPLRLKPNNKEPKKFRIRMSPDGTEVESLGPVNGTYKAKAVKLGPRPDGEDGIPMPETKVGKEGTKDEYHYDQFWCSYEITEGQFKGVTTPAYYLRYKFRPSWEDPELTDFDYNPNNKNEKWGPLLKDWGLVHGIWSEPIRWNDETILDVLEERLLENSVEVNLYFKNGYIKDVTDVDGSDDEVDFSDPDVEASLTDDEPDFLKEPEEIEEVQEKVHSAGRKNGNGKASKEAVTVTSKSKTKRVKVAAQDEDDDL